MNNACGGDSEFRARPRELPQDRVICCCYDLSFSFVGASTETRNQHEQSLFRSWHLIFSEIVTEFQWGPAVKFPSKEIALNSGGAVDDVYLKQRLKERLTKTTSTKR